MPDLEVRYSYRDCPTIKRFSQSPAFIRGLMGPFRSGKSSGCGVELVKMGTEQTPGLDGIARTRMLVVRSTFRQLEDTTIRTFLDWFPPERCGTYTTSNHNYILKWMQDREIEVMFRALDRPDHVANLLSLEATAAWVNEAREVSWPIIEALQGRIDQFPAKKDGGATHPGLIMDTNPPDADSRWYKFFEETKLDAGFAELFKQPGGLSPDAENLTHLNAGRAYYERLAIGKAPEWIKVYIDGEYGFVVDGKPVYTEYADNLHCPPDAAEIIRAIPEEPIYVGIDVGLTGAAVYTQILPNGHWLVLDEVLADGIGMDRFSDQLLEYQARKMPRTPQEDFEYIGDPAGESRMPTDERTCFEIMQAKGMRITAGLQNPQIRQESVRKTLRTLIDGRPQLLLHPRCTVLRKGFLGGYQYRRIKVSGERFDNKPDKGAGGGRYAACFVAGTPVSTPEGPRAIEHLRPGDLVETPRGPRRVTATMNGFSRDLLDLETNDRRQLRCTVDHPIARPDDSFLRADALQYHDSLVVERLWADQRYIPSKNLTASAFIASEEATTERHTTRVACGCIAPCGNFIMVRFLRAMNRITKTRSRAITTSTTSSSSPSGTITGFIIGFARRAIRNGSLRTWLRFGPSLRNGIDRQLAGNGIGSTDNSSLPLRQSILTDACGVARNIKSSAGPASVASAALPAKQQRVASPGSTMKRDPASSAAPHSASTDIGKRGPVVWLAKSNYVRPLLPVKVYDLTIEDAHCFYASGILVGNCHDALQYPATRLFGAALITSSHQVEDDDDEIVFGRIDPTRNARTGY